MQTTMKVWGRDEPVTVYQKSKSVWVAYGTYMDHSIEVKRVSQGAALTAWADAAKYKGG